MGVFRKLGEWFIEKGDRFVRGEGDASYRVAHDQDDIYSQSADEAAEEVTREPLDPFGHGEGEYGGRVPYRSRYDQAHEAQQAAPQQRAAAQPAAPQQPAHVPQQQAQYVGYGQQQGNVVPFPGMQHMQDGSVYAHVEYVVLLRSRNECKDVIAYIKANASVFLNMEFIASDSERQRCVDMLSGAAYTLGCALNKISPRGIYLISSPSVRVVLDPAMQKFTATPETQGFVRQRYENDPFQRNAYAPEAMQEAQQSGNGFSAGSPTTRFQAQATQQMPSSFGSVMAGNATGMYQPIASTGRFTAVQQ